MALSDRERIEEAINLFNGLEKQIIANMKIMREVYKCMVESNNPRKDEGKHALAELEKEYKNFLAMKNDLQRRRPSGASN